MKALVLVPYGKQLLGIAFIVVGCAIIASSLLDVLPIHGKQDHLMTVGAISIFCGMLDFYTTSAFLPLIAFAFAALAASVLDVRPIRFISICVMAGTASLILGTLAFFGERAARLGTRKALALFDIARGFSSVAVLGVLLSAVIFKIWLFMLYTFAGVIDFAIVSFFALLIALLIVIVGLIIGAMFKGENIFLAMFAGVCLSTLAAGQFAFAGLWGTLPWILAARIGFGFQQYTWLEFATFCGVAAMLVFANVYNDHHLLRTSWTERQEFTLIGGTGEFAIEQAVSDYQERLMAIMMGSALVGGCGIVVLIIGVVLRLSTK